MPNPLEQRIDRLERILLDGTKPLVTLVPIIEEKLTTAINQHENIKKWLIELTKEMKESSKSLEPRIKLLESQMVEADKERAEAKEDNRTHYEGLWSVVAALVGAIIGSYSTYFFMK